MFITLKTKQVDELLEQGSGVITFPVLFKNSTVLGYTSLGLWWHLLWDKPELVRPDHGGHLFHAEDSDYLHVPAWYPDEDEPDEPREVQYDELSYRVRSRYSLGDIVTVKERSVKASRLSVEIRSIKVTKWETHPFWAWELGVVSLADKC